MQGVSAAEPFWLKVAGLWCSKARRGPVRMRFKPWIKEIH